jgi:molybdate transport system regulatory protein
MSIDTNIKPAIKLSIVNSNSKARAVLGRGVVDLLLNVEKNGSLNKAAKQMNMSYSKAWKLIQQTEEALGLQLLIKKRPNGSELTEEAKKLSHAYVKLFEIVQKESEKRFLELMNE